MISDLKSEHDEYEAIQKFNLLQGYEADEAKKHAEKKAKLVLREELAKQQQEFTRRQQVFQDDMKAYQTA